MMSEPADEQAPIGVGHSADRQGELETRLEKIELRLDGILTQLDNLHAGLLSVLNECEPPA